MDAAEFKHVVLGIVFLKYLTDSTEEAEVPPGRPARAGVNGQETKRERPGFSVPPEARWEYLRTNAGSNPSAAGQLIDGAMQVLETANPSLDNVLPRDYSRKNLDGRRLVELLDVVASIGTGKTNDPSKDILGRVYEYFLSKFASAEGKLGGEFYTPKSVVELLVEMVEPAKGIIYDPCCGSGGMFVQSEKFVLAHGGRVNDLTVYGQESNPTTWRLCKMNLAIRGIDADIGPVPADTFHKDIHKQLKADFILANPPFNMSDWGGERLSQDARWEFGSPPPGNANFAWMQHMIYHLSSSGVAAIVLSNGALSSNQNGEAQVRSAIIEGDLIDCIVSLPPQLFYTTQIPVSVWVLTRSKNRPGQRDRRGRVLFVHAYHLGELKDRTHRELTISDISSISQVYHSWRDDVPTARYRDVPGFCNSVGISDIRKHRMALVPGRYVGFDKAAIPAFSAEDIRSELAAIRKRFAASEAASKRALQILEELLNGRAAS